MDIWTRTNKFLFHEPLVIQKAVDWAQKFGKSNWYDSVPSGHRMNLWIDWSFPILYLKLSLLTYFSLVWQPELRSAPVFDEAVAWLRTDSKSVELLQFVNTILKGCTLLVSLVVQRTEPVLVSNCKANQYFVFLLKNKIGLYWCTLQCLDYNMVRSKIKVVNSIVNDIKVIFGQVSSTSWWSTHLSKCTSFGAKFIMMLWQTGFKTVNVMIEADWASGSMHAQPLLTVVMVVAMTALIKGNAGTHVASIPWLCWVVGDYTDQVLDLCSRFKVDS